MGIPQQLVLLLQPRNFPLQVIRLAIESFDNEAHPPGFTTHVCFSGHAVSDFAGEVLGDARGTAAVVGCASHLLGLDFYYID
jgi:hypothetical protein